MPKVFIIILHWNNELDTLECLTSVQNIDYPNYEVVVIDNGSRVKLQIPNYKLQANPKPQIPNPKLKIIYNKENLGFAGGNNVGVKYALAKDADYILLLNNDTVVDKNFLKEMVRVGESDKNFGIIGSKIYFYNDRGIVVVEDEAPKSCLPFRREPRDETIWFAGGKISQFFIRGSHIGLNEIDEGQYDKIKIVDYITGCCLLIKREVVEKIGLIDEDYFLYYEDTDWCWRAKKIGYQSVFAPKAKIWHKCSAGAKEGSPSYVYYHSRNGLMMVKKNGSFVARLGACLVSFWIIFRQIIKILFFPKKRAWAKYVLSGIKDFYLSRRGERDVRR